MYPVASGTVVSISTSRSASNVSAGDGRTFEYWHIAPAVRVGARVTAAETVLGRVVRGAKHVHLTELHGETPVNPAAGRPSDAATRPCRPADPLDLDPEVRLDRRAAVNFVRGSVDLVVDASDTTNRAVPGIWACPSGRLASPGASRTCVAEPSWRTRSRSTSHDDRRRTRTSGTSTSEARTRTCRSSDRTDSLHAARPLSRTVSLPAVSTRGS